MTAVLPLVCQMLLTTSQGVCIHLDELVNVSNGWDKLRDKGLQRCVQLQHFRLVLHNVLEQIMHLRTNWQFFTLIWVIATWRQYYGH